MVRLKGATDAKRCFQILASAILKTFNFAAFSVPIEMRHRWTVSDLLSADTWIYSNVNWVLVNRWTYMALKFNDSVQIFFQRVSELLSLKTLGYYLTDWDMFCSRSVNVVVYWKSFSSNLCLVPHRSNSVKCSWKLSQHLFVCIFSFGILVS